MDTLLLVHFSISMWCISQLVFTLTLKIPSRKVSENHLYAYAVVAVQDDFSVLSDCFHD